LGLFLILSCTFSLIGIIALFILDDADPPLKAIMAFATIVLSILLSLIIMKAVNEFTEPEKSKYTIELVNLKSDTTTSGEVSGFIIFNGYIEEKSYYFFMVETEDGGYKRERLPANNSIVYEVEGLEQPYAEVYTSYQEPTFWYLNLEEEIYETKFYVPKGTIIKKFEIN